MFAFIYIILVTVYVQIMCRLSKFNRDDDIESS